MQPTPPDFTETNVYDAITLSKHPPLNKALTKKKKELLSVVNRSYGGIINSCTTVFKN